MSATAPELPELPANAFAKADPSPDTAFYRQPRFVAHIDPGAIAAVTRLYREVLPPGGVLLDLMGSWISHLPNDVAFAEVVGHGMNAEELAANPRLDRWFVQDLNANPVLPLDTDAFDAALMCVSVQYVQRPAELFAEIARVLRPGAPLVVSFSNRCFPTKAVRGWLATDDRQHGAVVAELVRRSGRFTEPTVALRTPPGVGDPLYAVTATRLLHTRAPAPL